jgi:hypothetical protein
MPPSAQAAQLAVLGTELQYLKNVVLSYLDRGSGKFSFEVGQCVRD